MTVRPDAPIGTLALRAPVRVAPDVSLRTAARIMRKENISSLVVDTQPPSLITERDLVRAMSEDGDNSAAVRTMSSRGPVWAQPSLTVAHAAAVMVRFGLRHIVVFDDGGTPVGVLSIRDALDVLLNEVDPNGWATAFPALLGDVG